MAITIEPYVEHNLDAVVKLSLRAWRPVFAELRQAVPAYTYAAFYPDGWEARQVADIEGFLRSEGQHAWVAIADGSVVGWVGIRLHPKDSMGEIYIIAVDPACQREGIATRLMQTGFEQMRAAGMAMVMVETGGDPGHAASRATYERAGFDRWPVARYFKEL